MCQMHHQLAGETKSTVGVSDFVEELVVAATSMRVYYHDHPRVLESIDALVRGFDLLLERMEVERIELGVADGYLFVGRSPLLGASLAAARIITPLTEIESGGIAFSRGACAEDFVVLVRLLGRQRFDEAGYQDANHELTEAGCTAIELLPPYQDGRQLEGRREGGALAPGDDFDLPERGLLSLDIPVRLYQDVVDHLQDAMINACNGEVFDLARTQGCVEGIIKRLDEDSKSILSISRYEQYDAFTFGHSIRVALLALNFARAFQIDEPLMQRIGTAALMHDIGKARVPFQILHSKGRLNDSERQEMNKHTVHGAEILLELGDADPMAVTSAFGHHRAQCGGYPELLHDAHLSMGTKIVKICDVFEALTAVRPYKDRMSPIRAYRIMMSMQDHFDTALLRKFIDVTGIYTVGGRVRLSNGEIARVHCQSDLLELPVVDVEAAPDDEPYEKDAQRRVDLSRLRGSDQLTVAETMLGAELG
jgi:putative nucleotidyltransferase with HDIG domain